MAKKIKGVASNSGGSGTPPEPVSLDVQRAIRICEAHGNQAADLLEIFHDLQSEIGFIPEEVLPPIAKALNLSRAEVYGVLTFYHDFRREAPGRHVVKICRAEACQSMNTDSLCQHAEKRLGAKFGETSGDGKFSLDAVYCLGNCALSPAMMIDGNLFGRVDAERFDQIVGSLDAENAA
jgi:formate dehydrogenase subunit gamma